MKITPLKRKPFPLKRKGNLKRKPPVPKEDAGKLWEFYLEIWNERPHRSEVSGTYLGSEPKSWMFDHLLEKNLYPELKYEKENIILVTLDEHTNKGNGFPATKHWEAIEKAKKRFL